MGVGGRAGSAIAGAQPPAVEGPAKEGPAEEGPAEEGPAEERPAKVVPAGVPNGGHPGVPYGVPNPQRAWQNWTLNCQGCHRADGAGSAGTAPSLKDTVSKFLTVPGGREYLGRVPGVATSPLGSAELAELMNWMFWRFDREHLPADFSPFTAEEIGRLRTRPLRLEAAAMRTQLLQQADGAAAP